MISRLLLMRSRSESCAGTTVAPGEARPGVAEGDLLIECLDPAGDPAQRRHRRDRRIEQPIDVDLHDRAAGHEIGGTGVSVPPTQAWATGAMRC